jgi:4-amino-4-deoxy-L-arabinose transferase-like glycosyltransferase
MKIRIKARGILAVLCLTLLASFFFKIENVPFVRLDDGELMQLSETFATRGFLGSQMMDTGHNEHLYYHVHPPLYYLVNGLVFKLGGVGVFQSRIVSLLSALAAVFLTFMLAGKMLKLSLSLDNFLILTVLFLSTPMFFVLARSNRPEMLTLFIVLSAILAYFYFRETRSKWLLILSALLSGMAMITQAYASFVFIYLFCLQYFEQRRNWRLLAIFVAVFAFPLIFYALWISRDFPAFVYQTFIARHAISNLGLASLLNRYCYFFSSFENVATTLFFLASLSLLFFLKFKSNDKPIAFIFSPPLLIKICFLAVFIFIPVINKYYYVILLPFIYLFSFLSKARTKANGFPSFFIYISLLTFWG